MSNGVVWKSIVGFEGLYEVNTLGEVRSLAREFSYYDPRWGKEVVRHTKTKLMQQYNSVGGYKFICLRNDGKYHQVYIHRLVAQTFIPNPENKPEVNHKDRNKANNHIDNLEWVTSKENSQHLLHSGYDWGAINRGKSLSAEIRAKISNSCKGKTGYVHTEETRKRFVKTRYQPVRCLTDGKTFACAKEADRYYGYSQVVSTSIKLNRPTIDGRAFEYMPKEVYYAVPL